MNLAAGVTYRPIFIIGATGTGKSAAALDLARRVNGVILTMDAMQVYREAAIGTSKPTPAEQKEILHGGLDLTDFGTHFDVALYLKHAKPFLLEQAAAQRPVIIVGGTGLYFRTLTQGLCEAPQGSHALRTELNALSVEALQARLRAVDAGMLERLDASNPRRLIRALEVIETTGKSLAVWQAETPPPLVPHFRAFWIARHKAELQTRLAARVDEMFKLGWIDEVRGLVERHGLETVQRFPGIGYREIAHALKEGRSFTSPLKNDILVTTRQYAKRQLTWFAREPNLIEVMLSGSQPFPADDLLLP